VHRITTFPITLVSKDIFLSNDVLQSCTAEDFIMSETRYCTICKQELGPENHSHICRACHDIVSTIEAKIDEM